MVKASKAVALQKKGKAPQSGGKRPRQQQNAESGSRKGAAKGSGGPAKRQKTQVSMRLTKCDCVKVEKCSELRRLS